MAAKTLSLSERTKTLVATLAPLIEHPTLLRWAALSEPSHVLQEEAIQWLEEELNLDNSQRFLLESLRAALFEDLHDAFVNTGESNQKKKFSWLGMMQYIFLAIAGTIFSFCEGFDGIASILSSFSAVPVALVFTVSVIFSLLSVGLFYGFKLVLISKEIGVNVGESGQLLDVLLEQVDYIDKLARLIDDHFASESHDKKARDDWQHMLNMLILRDKALNCAREGYKAALNDPLLNVAKGITAVMTALIFFSSGFFAGQNLALVIAGLFMASATATVWPVVLASTIVGLASLSLYWFFERPGLENLVGHWLGLDKESIEIFAGDERVASQKSALDKLQQKVMIIDKLQKQVELLSKHVALEEKPVPFPQVTLVFPHNTHASFYHRRSRSLDTLSSFTIEQSAEQPSLAIRMH